MNPVRHPLRSEQPTPEPDQTPPSGPEIFVVPAEGEGLPVEKVLRKLLAGRHPEHVAKLLRQGRVQLDGEPVAAGTPLARGQRLAVQRSAGGPKTYLPNKRIRLNFLYQDDSLVALNKPAWLPMHPGPGHGTDTVLNGLLARFPEELAALGPELGYGLVQRLDVGTSGVVVVALTAAAYHDLVRQFSERTVEKTYQALVHGVPAPPAGRLTGTVDGREAITDYRLLSSFPCAGGQVSHLELRPRTGRTHQIRVQLKEQRGCPIVGDGRYGPSPDHVARALYLSRPFLHAARLVLSHPRSQAPLTLEAPLPRGLRKALKRLEKGKGT